MTNYINKYKKYYNIQFDSRKYHIHHIDGNRENNDISNLLLLPASLHREYHTLLRTIDRMKFPTQIKGNAVSHDNLCLIGFSNFINVLNECNKWHDYKMYLEGMLPNIHNIWGL